MADETQTDTTETSTETPETETTQTDDAVDQSQVNDTADDADAGADDGDGSLMGKAKADTTEAAADDAPALPEKYELTAPEGFTIDDAILAEADPVFRELGLNNDQANKVITLAKPFAERLFAAQNDAHQAQASDWAKEVKADPELGGKNYADTENLVAKALDHFAGPAKNEKGEVNTFRQLLDDTKLGNHPEMMRVFRKIGEALGEGEFTRSDAGAQVNLSREAILYPNDVPKSEVNA